MVGRGQVDDAVDVRLAVELRLERLAVDLRLDMFDMMDGTEEKMPLCITEGRSSRTSGDDVDSEVGRFGDDLWPSSPAILLFS
jgi:hypothetical protein